MPESDTGRIADFLKSEYTRMVRYVRARLHEAADRDSEDIVSDVIARIFERADISAPIENLGAYVYRALKNRIIDILRTRDEAAISFEDEKVFLEQDLWTNDRESPHGLIEKKEMTAALYEAVMELPEELRSVFIMNEIDGKTFKEISGLTGIPAGTLMARKARAVDRLAKKLSNLRIYLED
ncbi:MAG: sigma-70 family RNA polymerase sigma factor [Deltaproteobacteria bacterium]|nr:sigma-70 family RNA polymerase sigma factor [Deltaproteobacteria bacterium]